jgi:cytochrome c-type protein NapC
VTSHLSLLSWFALACAAIAVGILVVYLVRRPPLTPTTRVLLLAGLGVFPIGLAGSGNIAGYEATKQRAFCGSCHVMIPHVSDSGDPKSLSLASRHGRNKLFGAENCYVCHADYGMYGTVTTKLGGLKHVWMYYTEYRNVSLEDAKKTIHLYKPYPNSNCMQCHSTENAVWMKRSDHASSLDDVRAGKVSCASVGCHGYAHPTTKPELEGKGGAP